MLWAAEREQRAQRFATGSTPVRLLEGWPRADTPGANLGLRCGRALSLEVCETAVHEDCSGVKLLRMAWDGSS